MIVRQTSIEADPALPDVAPPDGDPTIRGKGQRLVVTRGLTKQYGAVTALADCTFEVAAGEVFGLLGPNGAGKTTLLRLLMGYLRPTAGEAEIAGLDCRRDTVKVRKSVAYLPGEVRLFRTMRGRGILKFFAEIRPGGDYARSLELAKRLDLDVSRRVAFMSTGMRQKLALAATMAANTPLVILDEPTANLDPTVRGIVLELVAEAKRAGRTVMFSSHVLSEVEEVCDRVIILRAGRLVHTQALAELRQQHRIRAWLSDSKDSLAPPERFRDQLAIRPGRDGEQIIETPGELAPLLGWLSTLPLADLRIEPVGLRAIYDRFHAE